jgi:hypothetical protein
MERKQEQEDEYFKVMSHDFIHHGFKYEMGLNELNGTFNDDPHASCVGGRLYFTTREHIQNFFDYGTWLVTIKLPKDNSNFKMIRDPEGDKYGANMIILEEKYSLFDIKTYEKFGLSMTANTNIVYYACMLENTDFLDWWVGSNIILPYSSLCIDNVSMLGKIKTLNWWLANSNNIKLKYSKTVIERSCFGFYKNVGVVKWWITSGLKFTIRKCILDAVYNDKNTDIKDIITKYDIQNSIFDGEFVSVEQAFSNNDFVSLDIMIKQQLPIKYDKKRLKTILRYGNPKMLNYWRNNIKYFRI